jgi:hypothetical protein
MRTEAQPVHDQDRIGEIAAGISSGTDFADRAAKLSEIYEAEDPTVCYQQRDWRMVDYHHTRVAHVDYAVRGPVPDVLEPGRYFVTLGSAITFGACIQRPYATILSESLGMPVLNLAFSGASPEFFVKHHAEGLRHWLAGAAFVIVETMSSRSVSNSRFQSVEGRRDAIDLKRPEKPATNMVTSLRKLLANGKKGVLGRVIRESLEAHETLYDDLVAMSPAPVIGLWLSKRSPDAVNRDQLRKEKMLERAISVHPHFADRALVDQLAKKCSVFVEVSSKRGQPVSAVNRFNRVLK